MSDVSKTSGKRKVGDGTPGPGRPKGLKNKTTVQLKDMILNALNSAGGEAYLLERAKDPKTQAAFLALVGKVLPVTLQGDQDNPLHVTTINRVIVEPQRHG